ncbi:sodium:solute symporter family protein [Peredibacter starrii]|uniref:Sodium:solute symporter family protein n=1 Tax=Peredibacter starrii TaxID=28202 RepID=A0AAX4HJE5_9BACT|nr:sodium:solute symporter family protein [Peredibacter starrii]WPU63335.1 sodium:solute symporter family protein [Peredibacter starrii]
MLSLLNFLFLIEILDPMNWELFGISIYVVGMIGLGFYFSRRIKNQDDYFLGGRTLGPLLATFAIFATWFGAETCIGTAGAVYQNGLSSIHADPMGYTICLLVMGLFFAKVLWSKKITTIPDLFRHRYSPSIEKLTALLLIPSSVIWAGAQVRALGQIVHATTDFGPVLAVTVAAIVVIIYTMWGGMLADAYADLIQGIAIIMGLIFLLCSVIYDLGGIGAALSTIPTDKLSLGGGDMLHLSLLGKMELWLVPIFGSIMTQELVSRVAASRSSHVARNSTLRAASIYFLVGSIPVIIGLIGVNYMPGLKDPETLMPVLAKNHLHYVFYIIFVGALISAILSTVDTTLLASSALLSQNLVNPLLPNLSDKKKVLIARLGTLLSGVTAYVIAFSSDSITSLVETASSLGGPSIFVLTMIALWDKRGTALNAGFAMVMSIVTWLCGHYIWDLEYPVVLTVLVCGLSYFLSLPFTAISKDNHLEAVSE